MKGCALALAAVLLGTVPASAQTVKTPRPYEVRGYVYAASESTESPQTFDAILGEDRLTLFGGGGELMFAKRFLLRGQWSRFSATGTRVFVDNDETVFELGIPLDVRVTVTEFSAGYRFFVKPGWALFAAAGRSNYGVREKSNGETATSDGGGWHLLGGAEVKPHKWVLLAAEAQWTTTGDILKGGAAEALGESELGGIRIAARAGFRF